MAKMPEQFQCRFCPESYNEILGFLDHFETHMNQNEPSEQEQQDANQKVNSVNEEQFQSLKKKPDNICETDLTSKEKSYAQSTDNVIDFGEDYEK